ncbi:zeta toxin family protein [Sinomonas sp. JGH33]|uniref:Zeta toxin family protein n=1 Tax=Sinomonas terricola TaxID=3110330 RepID=A0ABU5T5D6_9MICC|nr:AAA family ATPase [Sinomonas sp. JGH33]MEA5454724.1 zeta toxin family protein [Sinomonas sp. JGH33]
MSSPVLHVLAGPNGAGKTTFVERVLGPSTGLPFINADAIAAHKWPGAEVEHSYEAARAADDQRNTLLAAGASFITETVFSHPSKVELVERAAAHGYLVTLHVIMIPEETTVRRVDYRASHGGHSVPESKIRGRYSRLWSHVAAARLVADRSRFYDNSKAASPFRLVAVYEHGVEAGESQWPPWTPPALLH